MDTTTEQETQVQQTEPAPKKASLWEDLVDVFISPAELYRRQANAGWVKPWLVLSVIMVALYFVFLGPNHEVSQATAREMLSRAGKEMPANAPGGGMVGQIIGGVFMPVGLLVGILLGGFMLWIASLVAQQGPRFKQAMMIVAWASFPMILQTVLGSVLVILKVNSGEPLSPAKDMSFGVLRFLDPTTLPLAIVGALRMVDVFTIWEMLLWLVALKVICHYSSAKAAAVAFATWLLMLLPAMAAGFLGQLAVGG